MTTLTFPTVDSVGGQPLGVDMSVNFFPVLANAVDVTETPTTFTVWYGPTEFDRFTGSGFQYDAFGVPIGGTITSWVYAYNGRTYMSATGASMPVAVFMNFVLTDDWQGFLEYQFGGNDTISGNAGADWLAGYDGNDVINAGEGDDTASGDEGNDKVYGFGGNDWLWGWDGDDTVDGGNGSDSLFGGIGNDIVLGGSGNDEIHGQEGDDILDGGTGADQLKGGEGNDLYILDNAGDVVSEIGIDSDDHVKSSVPIAALITGIEHYTYTGAAAWVFMADGANNNITSGNGADIIDAGGGADMILGNGGNDKLWGGTGDDWLDGGTGIDQLRGGAGNDNYVIDVAGDVIDEEGNADTGDMVRAAVSVNLSTLAGGLIEHAVLLGSAALNATGNAAANLIGGNDGANLLDGLAGADTMIGGKGNDTYIVDNAGDQVIEVAGGGIDLVKSSVSFSIFSTLDVENLTLTGSAVQALGNVYKNILTGNEGANILNGFTGGDTLIGGKGDDIYIVFGTNDTVSETFTKANGGGADLVVGYVSYSIASVANVEYLMLGGADHINGTGNALDNNMAGNAGNNRLEAGAGQDALLGFEGDDVLLGGAGYDYIIGGQGADTLTGGTERDYFHYDALADAGDTVTDFKLGKAGDVLDIAALLDDIGYGGTDPFLDAILSFSKVGSNTVVSIDADGVGAGTAVTLATLLNVTLTQANTDNYLV